MLLAAPKIDKFPAMVPPTAKAKYDEFDPGCNIIGAPTMAMVSFINKAYAFAQIHLPWK